MNALLVSPRTFVALGLAIAVTALSASFGAGVA
jgi:hypothetical protein